MPAVRRLAALLCAVLLSPAQAAATQPPGYVLSGMPLVRQTYNACGPASLTQVLAYFGQKISMQDVSRQTRPTERSYMTAQAIVAFAPHVGMQARLYSGGSLDTMKTAIRNGIPVIALQSHITSARRVIPHWRVLVGFNDATRQVYIMDPLLGYVSMGYDDMTRVWADQRGQFALMFPPRLADTVRRTIG